MNLSLLGGGGLPVLEGVGQGLQSVDDGRNGWWGIAAWDCHFGGMAAS